MDTIRRALPHHRSGAMLCLLAGLVVAACGGTPGDGTPGAGTPTGGSPTQATGGGASSAPPDVGTATQQPVGGEVVDACALLTDADIEEATGHKVTLREPSMQTGLLDAGCHWVLENPDSMVPPEIHFEILASGGADYYKRYFEPFNEENGYELIPGLGDIAVDADFGSIMVVSGDAFFNLQDLAFGSEKNNAEALARKIIANLRN